MQPCLSPEQFSAISRVSYQDGPFKEARARGNIAWLSSRLASLLPSASSLPENSRPADTVTLSPSAQGAAQPAQALLSIAVS